MCVRLPCLIHFSLCHRFAKLADPAADRKEQLEDSLKFQQFSRDVEEEMQWIKEHRPLAESSDYGKSLVGVQNLQKKHQALLNEITSYEGNIQSVDQSAKELVSCDHFASSSIEELNRDLQHGWKQLKLLAAGRTQKLADALEAQKVKPCTRSIHFPERKWCVWEIYGLFLCTFIIVAYGLYKS